MTAPTLHTARLLLRPHRAEDFEACAALWADPAVTHFIGGKPLSREDAWAKFLRYFGHWTVRGFGFWAVEEKATGRYIGELGFADFKRDASDAVPNAPEAGWVLAAAAHGKGYATEALRAAAAWIDTQATSTFCLVDPANAPSLRVAQKLGYRESGTVQYKGHTVLLLERPRPFTLRLARTEDIPNLTSLIHRSVRELQAEDYTPDQLETALECVYGVDTTLIADGTYFAAEWGGVIVACGGWSRRKTLYGGDQLAGREDSMLDPATDAAKIRAFFVHPEWTRRGLGSMILEACESAARAAGFRRFEMGATLTGVALYKARGYEPIEEIAVPMTRGLKLPIVRMAKSVN